MLSAWLFFWAGGLGLLVYSPIFALIAFVNSVRSIHNSVTKKRISTWLIGGTIAIILSYSILYKIQWDLVNKFVQEEALQIQKLDERIQYERNVNPFVGCSTASNNENVLKFRKKSVPS